jgi:hypothetical protein
MKKAYLAIILCGIILPTIAVAQSERSTELGVSVNLDNSYGYISNGSEIYFFASPNELNQQQLYILYANNNNQSIYVSGLTEVINVPLGTIFQWCGFGLCWAQPTIPVTEVEEGVVVGSDKLLYAEPELNASYDPATYKFSFMSKMTKDTLEVADTLSVTVHFVNRERVPAGIQEDILGGATLLSDTIIFINGEYTSYVKVANEKIIKQNVAVTVYPNPAIDYVTFDLGNEKSNVIIRSVSGNVVREITGASGFASTNVKGLASGIYFYTLERLNGAKVTGKLIVKQ